MREFKCERQGFTGLGFKVYDLGFRVQGSGLRVTGSRVQGVGCRVWDLFVALGGVVGFGYKKRCRVFRAHRIQGCELVYYNNAVKPSA